jgi:hypothetical protein
VTLDEAFAAVSHAFPQVAELQGRHFSYAQKNGVTLIESKKTVFEPDSECPHCGQHRGERTSRFFYWLLVDGRFKLFNASINKSRLAPMRTIGDSFPL